MQAEARPGGTSAHLLVDAGTGEVLAARDEHRRFRSASLVKLLIAVDHLLPTGGEPTAADRALLEPMLRASDDDAANELWERNGGPDVVLRMAAEMGLRATAPPRDPDMWGYTPITAADVVRCYRYLREQPVGEFVLANLRAWTATAADGFDQSFGLPGGAAAELVKQGWSGFGPGPLEQPQVNGKSRRRVPDERIDLDRPAMHTSGIVQAGAGARIAVVLTLHPAGTTWDAAAERISGLAREIAG